VRRDHVDAILLKLVIEAVAVIRPIANEMFRLGLEHIEVVTQLDQGDFMMMGGMRTDREGQPVPIHNREDLHVFTAFGEPDGLAAALGRRKGGVDEKASAYGIEIQDVRIKRADLPEQNEKAVFSRMQAERERQAKQYRAEGAEEAQKIKSEAEKDREIILAEAYRESEELRGGGDAKAFRIYADAYRQDPHFFEFTRTMEAYRKTLKEKTTILVSPDSEFFRFLKQR